MRRSQWDNCRGGDGGIREGQRAGKTLGVAIALAIATASSNAAAHAGIPRAYDVLFEPGNPEHTILRSYLWGFFDTRDGAKTWQYTCAEAYRGRSTSAQTRSIAMLPGGRILVANYFDGLHLSDDGCEWWKHPAFPEAMVTDVRFDPQSGSVYLASTLGDGTGFDSKLFHSKDRGDTWQLYGAPLPRDFSPSQIGFGSADPNTVYVSGKGYNTGDAFFLRSRDGYATFERYQLPVQRDRWQPRIQAIHPGRPELIFIWVDGEEELNEDNPDEYLVTADEGATYKSLFLGTGDLPGFAISPDGKKVLIGGSRDGIHEADLDRALAEGPAAFQQIYARPIWGMQWSAQGLFAGGENYGAVGEQEFTLGLSTDGGRTFTPLMTVCDVQFSKCPAESTVGQRCTEKWEGDEAQQGLKEEFVDVRCGGATAPDGGGGAPPLDDGGGMVTGGASGGSANGGGSATNAVTEGGGCACQAPARNRLPRAASFGIAFLVGLLAGRRSRSRAHAS